MMEYEKEQAFINAVRGRREQMYRIALGYLRNSQDAEDAVSDAVEATWKSLKRIRNADALPAYLIRCTINAARYQLRKRHKTQSAEQFSEYLAAGDVFCKTEMQKGGCGRIPGPPVTVAHWNPLYCNPQFPSIL